MSADVESKIQLSLKTNGVMEKAVFRTVNRTPPRGKFYYFYFSPLKEIRVSKGQSNP